MTLTGGAIKSMTSVAAIAVILLCTINSANAEDALMDNRVDTTVPTSSVESISTPDAEDHLKDNKADNTVPKSNIECINVYPDDMLDIVRKGDGFLTSFKPMYLGYSVYDKSNDGDGEIKFQISFKYNIVNNIFLGYTQKTFWDIKDKSAPIKETDFSPEIFYIHNNDNCEFGKNTWLPYQYMFMGLRHESNGIRGADSVGWNMLYIEPFFALPRYKNLIVSPALWYPFTNSHNKVLVDDIGIGKLTVKWQHFKLFQLSSEIIRGLKGKKYGVESKIDFFLDQSKKWFSPTVFVQVWNGYGETLASHAINATKVIIGFSVSR
jgi:outer membrane phospholipase A